MAQRALKDDSIEPQGTICAFVVTDLKDSVGLLLILFSVISSKPFYFDCSRLNSNELGIKLNISLEL